MAGTLMAHCGAEYVTRDELRTIETPEPMGRWHKPIPHIELVETLDKVLTGSGIEIAKEQFAVQKKGRVLFATFDFAPSEGLADTPEGRGHAMGFRGANDQSMPLEIAVGGRIFVCDNMAFAPGLVSLKRKHTIGLDLAAELNTAVGRFVEQTGSLTKMLEAAEEKVLTEDQAKVLIFDAFTKHEVMPSRLFPKVARFFFEPTEEESPESTDRRSLMDLHNAFTRAAKELKPNRRFDATAKLGGLLTLGCN